MTQLQRLIALVFAGTALLCGAHDGAGAEAGGAQVRYETRLEVVHKQLDEAFCWFHPRAASVPGRARGGGPLVVLTLQKHLKADDHYSGLYHMLSEDGGASWSAPELSPELDWRTTPDGVTLAVCDVTPGWHGMSGRVLAIGIQLRYSKTGEQLLDQPGAHRCAYAVFDPATRKWTAWKLLEMPDIDGRFFLVAPGCTQWLVKPDGTLLLPIYHRGPQGTDYSVTVLRCSFDGAELKLLGMGNTLSREGGRGYVEPSLASWGGRYYLTLRNDARGYVAESGDGLTFGTPMPWRFDDGTELGSYNTQQHWIAHPEGLLLAYTRRGATNDHIPRSRAPIFAAEVDLAGRVVRRASERVLIPERGAMLGNFGVCMVSERESWVTDSEFVMGKAPLPRGADGSTFAARLVWARPGTSAVRVLCLGDSITRGHRPGVGPHETFVAQLGVGLSGEAKPVEVINSGVGGERVDQALARLDRDVLGVRPSVVTVMYGANDSYIDPGKTEPRLPLDRFARCLEELVDRLQHQGIRVVLMTEPKYGPKPAPNGLGENPDGRMRPYMEACREVARRRGLALVDHHAIWAKAEAAGVDLGTWSTDQLHPNAEGHRRMAEAMLPVVRGRF